MNNMKFKSVHGWLNGLSTTAMTLLLLSGTTSSYAMQPLDDAALSQETGQAAYYTNYIGTGDLGNPNAGNNIGFFTLGLNATLSLNANINRLQLGCGGVNGAGCDIDLAQVRLTGTAAGPSGTWADSDATLTNPFFQLAIQNPLSLSTRHVVGIAFGSQSANALLSIGQNEPTTQVDYSRSCNYGAFSSCTPATPQKIAAQQTALRYSYAPGTPGGSVRGAPTSSTSTTGGGAIFGGTTTTTTTVTTVGGETGINSLSGNVQIAVSNLAIPLTIQNTFLGVADGSGDLTIDNTNNAQTYQPGGVYYQYLSGKRLTGMTLGPLKLDTSSISGLASIIGAAYGRITPQNLIDVHNLNASSTSTSGLLLSLNSMPIYWPQVGSSGVYSFPTLATCQAANLCTNSDRQGYTPNVTSQSLQAQTGWWLTAPRADIGGTSTTPLHTAPVTLDGTAAVLSALGAPGVALPSLNLQQTPVPNCYNNMKFC